MALFLAVLARFAVVAHVARVLFGKLELIAHQRFGWRVAPLASNDNAAPSSSPITARRTLLPERTAQSNIRPMSEQKSDRLRSETFSAAVTPMLPWSSSSCARIGRKRAVEPLALMVECNTCCKSALWCSALHLA